MNIYDFCLAWEWEYDSDFAQLVEVACLQNGLTFLQITPANLEQILQSLTLEQVTIKALFDRASDSDERFVPLIDWARAHRVYRINPFGLARKAWDKVNSHISFEEAGIPIPRTLILPSFNNQPSPSPFDLSYLGEYFNIKPAHGGGGYGVLTHATCWSQVIKCRLEYPDDQYLLQAFIEPVLLDNRQAWFRIIYCNGVIYPCWWNTHTHVYLPITEEEIERYELYPLIKITQAIHDLCNLELFSTEIALNSEGEFIVVDYVNDPIDLRLQSKAIEGVPDQIVREIATQLAQLVIFQCINV